MHKSTENRYVVHVHGDKSDSTDDNFHTLTIPGIFSTDESQTDDERPTSSGTDCRVTPKCRQQYLRLLERSLRHNYRNLMQVNSDDGRPINDSTIHSMAKYLETKALKRCMVLSLYQNSIFELINEIRSETIKQRPYRRDKMANAIKCRKSNDMTTMTTDSQEVSSTTGKLDAVHDDSCKENTSGKLTLDARIKDFEERLEVAKQTVRCNLNAAKNIQSHTDPTECKRARNESCDSRQAPVQVTPEITMKSNEIINISDEDDDEITKELNALFSTDCELDIFSDSNNSQMEAIFMEIDRFDPSLFMECQTESRVVSDEPETFDHSYSKVRTSTPRRIQSTAPALNDNPNTDLRESMWPCELHMQRTRLRLVWSRKSESELRNTVKIKRKLTELFGACDTEYDEDFEGPYSPSIELTDPILMGSCLKRIAPWVVKHLMVPMRRGLIANRQVFKKLAKHIAEGVLATNQYPGKDAYLLF